MRKVLALALVLITASVGLPAAFAQSARAAQLASVSGRAVDAVGGAVIGARVELVRDGNIVQTTTTGLRGEWLFANLDPGDYVVRMTVNDQTAGIRVSLAAGQTLGNNMIVAPSAAAPATAFLAALGLLGGLAAAAAVAAVVITTAIVVTGS